MADHSYDDITIEPPDFGATVRRPLRMFFGADPGWSLDAATALSAEAVVERWRGGLGFRQHQAGLRPLADVEEFQPSDGGSGMRVSLSLDLAYVGSDFALPTDPADLNLHDPDCSVSPGTGHVLFRDHRSGPETGDVLYR
ncbi:hypothetical protein [Kitasatospora sp. NPDC058190]|uniref:hypothetical protein n=1 Tax=Kitasatospora sp. NPDC058190 TaxID=3346371 RepID=UPI0036DB0676